jgi:hypothetical protein
MTVDKRLKMLQIAMIALKKKPEVTEGSEHCKPASSHMQQI